MPRQLKTTQNYLRAVAVQEKGAKTMVEQLKNFQVDRLDLEELTELSAIGRMIVAENEALGQEVPDWLTVNLKSLRREIKTRTTDQWEKNLREKKARLQSLKPAEERRKDLQAEIDALERQVAGV